MIGMMKGGKIKMDKQVQQKLTCGSFFAGVGGIDKGFELANGFEVVYANEMDSYPVKTYELNANIQVDCRDIRDVNPDEIPDFDVCMAGFPCQAFSVAGYRQGFQDDKGRGTLFFEVARIIEAKRPKIIFLENVKNLVHHDNGHTFQVIIDTLHELGYHITYAVLNAMEYGNVPQNRERIYIVGFLDEDACQAFTFPEKLHELGYHITYAVLNAMEYGNVPQNRERIYIVGFLDEDACQAFTFPEKIDLTTRLDDVIDFHTKLDEKYYYTDGKYKGDIYQKLVDAMDDDRAVYQWRRHYVRKNKSGVVPTLTANQGTGGHNVCLIKTDNGIRKMTPHECFNVQGFPKDFRLPSDMAESRLYKQAGNSVCVSVITRIAEQILKAV